MAFFGGVYGSQPVGREMVMRLARHVAEGAKRNDVTISRLLDKLNIYFLPTIDRDGFEQVRQNHCQTNYDTNETVRHQSDFLAHIRYFNVTFMLFYRASSCRKLAKSNPSRKKNVDILRLKL